MRIYSWYMFWNLEHPVCKPWTSDLMLAAEATCHLSNWNLEQVCKPWTGLLTLNRSWPITSAAPGHMIYWACSFVKIWCSRFTVSDIEIWCKALTLVLVPGHKIYWACSVEMFEVYICLFKVYRGVQGVLGSFTFILTVFEVYISSIRHMHVKNIYFILITLKRHFSNI